VPLLAFKAKAKAENLLFVQGRKGFAETALLISSKGSNISSLSVPFGLTQLP
jgi:hypothetical protein